MQGTKAELRRVLLTRRAAIPEATRRDHGNAMLARVRRLPCFEEARSLLGYEALGAEADPYPLMASRVVEGVRVFVPASGSDGKPLWVAWSHRSSDSGGSGVSVRSLEYPVVVIVPGVGFDVRGGRLGRGRGFYDHALADLRRAGAVRAVGLAFECQIVSDVPSDAWDQRVDFIASESRLLVAEIGAGSREEAGTR